MRASVTEARVTVYVCVHMPRECVCEKIFKLGLLWYKLYDVPIFMILLKK